MFTSSQNISCHFLSSGYKMIFMTHYCIPINRTPHFLCISTCAPSKPASPKIQCARRACYIHKSTITEACATCTSKRPACCSTSKYNKRSSIYTSANCLATNRATSLIWICGRTEGYHKQTTSNIKVLLNTNLLLLDKFVVEKSR